MKGADFEVPDGTGELDEAGLLTISANKSFQIEFGNLVEGVNVTLSGESPAGTKALEFEVKAKPVPAKEAE